MLKPVTRFSVRSLLPLPQDRQRCEHPTVLAPSDKSTTRRARQSRHDESRLECSLLGDACWQLNCLTAWQMRDPVWSVVCAGFSKKKKRKGKRNAISKLGGWILLTGWKDVQSFNYKEANTHSKSLNPIVWPAEVAKVGCEDAWNDLMQKENHAFYSFCRMKCKKNKIKSV